MTGEKPEQDSLDFATTTDENYHCPINCPNRQGKEKQPVVGGGYLFALIVAIFLGIQSFDASYKRIHGKEDFIFATKSPPSILLITSLTLIGLGLGIEIDKTMVSSTAKGLLGGLIDTSKSEPS